MIRLLCLRSNKAPDEAVPVQPSIVRGMAVSTTAVTVLALLLTSVSGTSQAQDATGARPRNFCGPNSLLIALTLLSIPSSMESILQEIALTDSGTTLRDIKVAAIRHGAECEGYRMSWGDLLQEIDGGAVAIIDVDNHFVSMFGKHGRYFISDPPRDLEEVREEVTLDRPDLDSRIGLVLPVETEGGGIRRFLSWSGVALIIRSKQT